MYEYILRTHTYSSSPFIKAYTLISEANHKFISSKVKERRRGRSRYKRGVIHLVVIVRRYAATVYRPTMTPALPVGHVLSPSYQLISTNWYSSRIYLSVTRWYKNSIKHCITIVECAWLFLAAFFGEEEDSIHPFTRMIH